MLRFSPVALTPKIASSCSSSSTTTSLFRRSSVVSSSSSSCSASFMNNSASSLSSSSTATTTTASLLTNRRYVRQHSAVGRGVMGMLRFAGMTAALTVSFLSGLLICWPVIDNYLLPYMYRKAVLLSNAETNLPIAKVSIHDDATVKDLRDMLFGIRVEGYAVERPSWKASGGEEVLVPEGHSEDDIKEAAELGLSLGKLAGEDSAFASSPWGVATSTSADRKKKTIIANTSTSGVAYDGQLDLPFLTEDEKTALVLTGRRDDYNPAFGEDRGRVVFLTGSAGTGKSSLIAQLLALRERDLQQEYEEKIKREMEEEGENFEEQSFTVGGTTIDRFSFGATPEARMKLDSAELQHRAKRRHARQPLVYINCRGFVDASTFFYTTITNIVSPNLGFGGKLMLAYFKLFHVTAELLALDGSSDDALAYLLFAQSMNHLRIGMQQIALMRRANQVECARPVVVIDSWERALDIISIHGKSSGIARFPNLLAQLLLRSALDEGICDVLILSDPRVLHDGRGTCIKHTKLERAFPDLAVRADFATLQPKSRKGHRHPSSRAESNTDRIVGLMKAYHARPFLLRHVLKELSDYGTVNIPSVVRKCYMEPDQVQECLIQCCKANLCFPAMGPVLGSPVKAHPRRYHYVSRRDFLPEKVGETDCMEIQYVKPRMGIFNYLLCAAFPWYGANSEISRPSTVAASNGPGGAEKTGASDVLGGGSADAGGGGGGGGATNININVSLGAGGLVPRISESIVYCDIAFDDCMCVKGLQETIVDFAGPLEWLTMGLFGLMYCEEGEQWIELADMDDMYCVRNGDQFKPKPAPPLVRDAISIGFWSLVALGCKFAFANNAPAGVAASAVVTTPSPATSAAS